MYGKDSGKDSGNNIFYSTCSSYSVTLTVLPIRGGDYAPFPLKLSGLLWLFRSIEYGRSDIIWLPRLAHRRQCIFHFICWNSLSLSLQPLCKQSDCAVRKPKQADHVDRPWATWRERDARPAPSTRSPHLTSSAWETPSQFCTADLLKSWLPKLCKVGKGLLLKLLSLGMICYIAMDNGNSMHNFISHQGSPNSDQNRYHCTSTRMTKMEKSNNTKCRGGCGATGNFTHGWKKCQYNHFENLFDGI